MDRDEHLAWAKRRALEYVDVGQLDNAVMSLGADLAKHAETRKLLRYMPMSGHLAAMNDDAEGVRRWIEGFD